MRVFKAIWHWFDDLTGVSKTLGWIVSHPFRERASRAGFTYSAAERCSFSWCRYSPESRFRAPT